MVKWDGDQKRVLFLLWNRNHEWRKEWVKINNQGQILRWWGWPMKPKQENEIEHRERSGSRRLWWDLGMIGYSRHDAQTDNSLGCMRGDESSKREREEGMSFQRRGWNRWRKGERALDFEKVWFI